MYQSNMGTDPFNHTSYSRLPRCPVSCHFCCFFFLLCFLLYLILGYFTPGSTLIHETLLLFCNHLCLDCARDVVCLYITIQCSTPGASRSTPGSKMPQANSTNSLDHIRHGLNIKKLKKSCCVLVQYALIT